MRRLLQILLCSVALAAVGPLVTATALASGTGTSAGDQQYVDPLGTTTTSSTPSSAASATTPTPNSTSGTGSSSSSSAGASTATTPASSTTPSSSSTHAAGATLPYTGLNVGACVAVGLAMLGGGLLLRRTLRRA